MPPRGVLRRCAAAPIGAVAALGMILAACSSSAPVPVPSGSRPVAGVAPSSTGGGAQASRAPTYEIVAPILHPRGSSETLACDVVLQSLPPAGCSGVRISGYDFEHLPGVVHTGRAWWTNRAFLLVGTWTGKELVVTHRPASRRNGREEPPLPRYCRGYADFVRASFARKITRHRDRIHLLSLTPCGSKVFAVVAVADRATRSYTRRHFGTRVLVDGWLRHPSHS
jgi:hypothetical protein